MAVPVISRSRIIVGESDGFAEFVVRLNAFSTQTVSVQYSLSDSEANYYDDNTTTLSFAPGETVKTVRIGVTDDVADEKNGPLYFYLFNPTNATIGDGLVTAVIVDDDGTPGITPAIGVANPVSDEKPAEAVSVISPDQPTYDDSYIDINTTTLSFTPDGTDKTASISLTGDATIENNGPFHFAPTNQAHASIDIGWMTASIPDNDSMPVMPAPNGIELFAVNGALPDIATPIQPLAAQSADAPLLAITQDQVTKFVTGFEQTLTEIEANLIAQVFGDNLPLLGDHLAGAAAGDTPALHFVTALKSAFKSGLATLTGSATYTETQVEQAFNTALAGTQITFGIVNLDTANPADIKLTISNIHKSFVAFDTALDSSFGLPGLGIQSSGGTAHTALNYMLNFSGGLDGAGFYVNTADNASTFQAGFTTTVAGLDVPANFSRMHYQVTDASAANGGNVAPTNFNGTFTLDLLDPGSQGADNKLHLSELTAGADLLNATLNANANVNLNLASDLGSAVLPSITSDLNVVWNFSNAAVIAGDANENFGGVPQVAFKNIKLDLGSFFSDFAGPVLEKVQIVTEPLQPIFDALTKPIPALEELVNAAGLSGAVPTRLLDILVAGGQVSPEGAARIGLLAEIAALANSVPGDGGGVKIDLGDFNLGGQNPQDPRALGFQLTNAPSNQIRKAAEAVLQSDQLKDFLGHAVELKGGGLAFPIIQDPQSAFGLLLGKDVNFFTYDAPDFSATAGFDQFFPVIGPLGIRLQGSVAAVAKLDFGYDSRGLTDYAATGFNDPAKIYNGFFVVDQNGPEATFDASIKAFLAVNVILAEPGIGGGILGHAQISLEDPTPGDSKLRLTEIVEQLSRGCLFDLSGKVTAGVNAYIKVGWGPFSHTFNFDGPSTELVNFDGTTCNDTGNGNAQPVLARVVSVNVALNIGPDAPLRIRGDNTDTIEFFGVEHVSGAVGNEAIRVLAFSLAPQQYTLGSGGEIRANGGVLDDTIVFAPEVLTRGVVHGGDGNDQIWGGAGADALFGDAGMDFLGGRKGADTLDGGASFDMLDGGAGKDTLRGGVDADILIGGPGADQLDGGSGDDTASYITATMAVVLDLATPGASTGDAAGDVFISIERFYGSDFNDTLRGDAASNYLAGDKGKDLIEGRAGSDLLIGGNAADTLNGGDGVDYVSYIDGKVAVNVSLATGNGSGGFAQGDKLISIENLEGVDTVGLPGDVLEGNELDNEIRGLGGADALRGLDGADLLLGGLDNDLLIGGTGGDTLQGELGDDKLLGGFGIDILLGGEGGDTLNGGGDADMLQGDAGADLLDGGAGNDRLDGGADADTLSDLAGNNQLFGSADNDLLTAGPGNDVLDGGTGNDNLDAGNGANKLVGGDGNDLLLSGTGADRLEGGNGNDTANSGAGNDTVLGGADNDVLDGGIGNDRVDGGIGDDLLSVGAMRTLTQDTDRLDHLFGGLGFDTISADFSNQTKAVVIVAGLSQSILFADGTEAKNFENVHDLFTGSGDDSLRLDGAADDHFANLLKTGAGNDTIYSGAGSDNVDARDGDDFVNGGSNDVGLTFGGFGVVGLTFTGPAETLAGGLGIDTLSFEGFSGIFPDNVSRNAHFGVVINLSNNKTGGAATGITISGFENLIGTNYGDDLTGDAGANFFDPLRGGGTGTDNSFSATTFGPDRIDGLAGDDTLHIDFSRANVDNAQGVSTNGSSIYRLTIGNTATVDSYIYQNIEHLQITGASKNDTLYPWFTGANSDFLSGLGGNDMLGGHGGADTLLGGDGNDNLSAQGSFTFEYSGIAGEHDVLDGGAGDDLVEDIAFAFPGTNLGADALFQLDGGTGFDTLSADFSNQAAIVWNSAAPTNMEFADGAFARNFEALRYFASGAGNDVITQGGRVDNRFYLGAGNDTVNPGLGVDSVDGGTGFDVATLDFSVGDTALMAGVQGDGNASGGTYFRPLATDLFNRPDNIVLSNFERVQITGTSKDDKIAGTYGDDTLIGGDGNDVLNGWFGGNNFLDGGNGDDTLIGAFPNNAGPGTGGGNDTMLGGSGADTLFGSHGDDILRGGDGNDVISAGDRNAGGGYVYGVDVIDGGAGDDVVSDGFFSSGTSFATAATRLQLDGGAGFDKLSADFGNQTQAITFIGGAGNSLNFADGSHFRNFEALGIFTSGSGNDTLIQTGRVDNKIGGGTGDDTINPGLGIDYIIGGGGDDLLILDYSAGDTANVGGATFGGQIGERRDLNTNAVLDSINAVQFQRYQITGGSKADNFVGGGFADQLNGNGGNDKLSGGDGNDTFDGGAGADSMTGDNGSDNYYVDDANDVVTETNNQLVGGNDTVYSTLSAYTLTSNVENLHILANGLANGTGNSLDNTLYAASGNNVLDGSTGIDTASYTDATTGVTISLASGAAQVTGGSGSDTLISIENLTGSNANDKLTGNGLANILNGGAGNDILTGGLAKDTYQLTEAVAATDTVRIAAGNSLVDGYDVVNDFKLGKLGSNTGVDKLDLTSNQIAANANAVNGVDSGVIHSHRIVGGLITFDDIDSYTASLTISSGLLGNVVAYLQANITVSNTVAFNADGNTFVFQDGGANDTLVQLMGVTANSLSTTGLVTGTVWIA